MKITIIHVSIKGENSFTSFEDRDEALLFAWCQATELMGSIDYPFVSFSLHRKLKESLISMTDIESSINLFNKIGEDDECETCKCHGNKCFIDIIESNIQEKNADH